MALPNPSINPPLLPSSAAKRRLHSPSPSGSPARQYYAQQTDPLLRDLSPSTTLRAFSQSSGEAISAHLNKSIENASHAERAVGVQAAQACMDLRSWVREVEGWEWPGTFEPPEAARKEQRMSSMSIGSIMSRPSMQVEGEGGEAEFWGSLPAPTVRTYRRRLDEINSDLEEINVEELKAFVLSAHSQAGYGEASIDDSTGTIAADTNFRRLDDFTALITATILQALPYLSRLHRILQTWQLRLNVLRATPTYLHDLKQARTDLDHGWAALAISSHPAAVDAIKKSNGAQATFSREIMEEMKQVVQTQVHSLGRRLDAFLDLLEGREECVPDAWIEEFETLEEMFGTWVVRAERKVLENEWRAVQEEKEVAGAVAGEPNVRSWFTEESDDDERPDTARTITAEPTTMTTSTAIGEALSTEMNISTHTTSTGPLQTTVTTVSPHISAPTSTTSSTHTSTTTTTDRSSNSRSPSRPRSRHVPIDIDPYKDPSTLAQIPVELPTSNNRSRSISPLPPTTWPITSKPAGTNDAEKIAVKKRAAFLNGGMETSGLAKSKSPPIVRPFEHASNAFTRLFKKDGHATPEKKKSNEAATLVRSSSNPGAGAGAAPGAATEKKRSSSSKRPSSSILNNNNDNSNKKSNGSKDGASTRSSQLSSRGGSSASGSKTSSGGSRRFGGARRSLDDGGRGKMMYGDMVYFPIPDTALKTEKERAKERERERERGSLESRKPRERQREGSGNDRTPRPKMETRAQSARSPEENEGDEASMPEKWREDGEHVRPGLPPKNHRVSTMSIEYRDMAGLPVEKESPSKSRKSKGKSVRNMEYGDMASMPEYLLSGTRPTTSRRHTEKGVQRTVYNDMVTSFERPLNEDERILEIRPGTSRRSTDRGVQRTPYDDTVSAPRPIGDENQRRRDIRPSPPRKANSAQMAQHMDYLDMLQLPSRSSTDPARSLTDPARIQPAYLPILQQQILDVPSPLFSRGGGKRSSRQNITALPPILKPTTSNGSSADSPGMRSAPETYQPSGLHSPFQSPTEDGAGSGFEFGLDVPEDWPLSTSQTPQEVPASPVKSVKSSYFPKVEEETVDGAEIYELAQPIATPDFDDIFVQTITPIPPLSVKRPTTAERAVEREVGFHDTPASASTSQSQSSPEDTFIVWNKDIPADRSLLRTGVKETSRRLDWDVPEPAVPRTNLARSSWPRPVSRVEEAEEESTEDEDEDEGEISDTEAEDGVAKDRGNAASYFGSAAKISPTLLRTSSSRPSFISKAPLMQRSTSMPPVSPVLLRLRIPDSPSNTGPGTESGEGSRGDSNGLVRRASTASIEHHSRSELKRVDVVRRSSIGSAMSVPSTPCEALASPSSAVETRHSVDVIRTPAPSSAALETRRSVDVIRSPVSPLSHKGEPGFPNSPSAPSPVPVPPRRSSLRSSLEMTRGSPETKSKGELNEAMPKRKYKDVPRYRQDRSTASPPTKEKKKAPLKPGEDNFDRHVSEVLDRVHAPIRFKTRAGAETPQLQRVAAKAGVGKKNLTLAPADPSPKKASPADPEVKLYHLTQAGRSERIKLFVRLVGEGERVMVRVGGGWADLADYLRQYAEHHGSRTASGESVLELQTASAMGAGKRTFSTPVAESKALLRGSPLTPQSAVERPRTSASVRSWLGQEQPQFSMGDSEEEGGISPIVAQTKDTASRTSRSPRSSASRPSTAQSNSRPTTADGNLQTTGLSMGGSAGKIKADLPEQKAKWVEGMIQQVNKSASAEKSREEREKYFGDMGKVGGTRRVVFRSPSGAQQQ